MYSKKEIKRSFKKVGKTERARKGRKVIFFCFFFLGGGKVNQYETNLNGISEDKRFKESRLGNL